MRIVDHYLVTLNGDDKPYLKETHSWERRCVGEAYNNLPILVNSIYIRHFFDIDTKNLVHEVLKGIGEEFMKILESNTWMDEITKQRAINKLKSMKALIGFPDELLDNETLKKHLENLTISDNFFESTLSINIFNNYQKFKNLQNDINKTDWRIHYSITAVNAYYLPFDNIISESEK